MDRATAHCHWALQVQHQISIGIGFRAVVAACVERGQGSQHEISAVRGWWNGPFE